MGDIYLLLLTWENDLTRRQDDFDDGKFGAKLTRFTAVLPGVVLCLLLTLVSIATQQAEERIFGYPYVEALVVAILLGMIIRSIWDPPGRWKDGIAFSAKQVLEFAVMLLGASISFLSIFASGPILIGAIVGTVVVTLAGSYSLCRLLGLPTRLSILIASGNSICGNSAIAAVAPVIGADADEVVSSISFTAILGVLMVLALPLLIPLLQLSARQYGILAGLTVYAVPQVLAATVPVGLVSTQLGTLVKLVRVLMLGPLVLCLSLAPPSIRSKSSLPIGRFGSLKLVPWFIVGFLVLGTLRSLQFIPEILVGPIARLAASLTVVSMAALGLSVDIKVLSKVGGKISAAVTLSLLLLLAISIVLVRQFA
jgi:uncharacterized integral membrane protein (TIGR00698 family)